MQESFFFFMTMGLLQQYYLNYVFSHAFTAMTTTEVEVLLPTTTMCNAVFFTQKQFLRLFCNAKQQVVFSILTQIFHSTLQHGRISHLSFVGSTFLRCEVRYSSRSHRHISSQATQKNIRKICRKCRQTHRQQKIFDELLQPTGYLISNCLIENTCRNSYCSPNAFQPPKEMKNPIKISKKG